MLNNIAIGVDPGRTTGIAVVGFDDENVALLRAEQWSEPDRVPARLLELAFDYKAKGHKVVLVIEQWDKRPAVINPDYTPMYIIKDIQRDIEEVTDIPIMWQIPSAAKNLVKPTNKMGKGNTDQLKRFGWYQRGKGHANDAIRHVILYLVEGIKHMPTIRLGWPER